MFENLLIKVSFFNQSKATYYILYVMYENRCFARKNLAANPMESLVGDREEGL